MDDRELKWRHYELLCTEETKQLDLLIKFNIFYYGITGAILSYSLSNIDKIPNIMLSLWLPILMGIFCGGIMLYMAPQQDYASEQMERIANQLWGRYSPLEQEIINRLFAEQVPEFINLDDENQRKYLKEQFGIDPCGNYGTNEALKLYLSTTGLLLIAISIFCIFMFFSYKHIS